MITFASVVLWYFNGVTGYLLLDFIVVLVTL